MPVRNNIPGVPEVLQEAISMYTDEAYTDAKRLSGTAIVGSNDDINKDTETFIGQVRWNQPLNPTINVASLTDPTPGTKSTYGTDFLKYIKTVRTHGAQKVNMAQVVSRHDGLAKFGRDFGKTQATDEHNAILSILKGVAISEALNGAAAGSGNAGLGGQTFDNDPTDKRYGFYVDLGNNSPISATGTGAARAEAFLNAFGMAYKDFEPEYAYLVTSPSLMASLRSANLVDSDSVTDGNVVFNTIFSGKFRLIQTRASQSLSSAEMTKINTGAGVDIAGTKVSFVVLPGSLAMEHLDVPDRVEITRDGNAYKGGGLTSIWYRWGYVLMPAGYDWSGNEDDFVSDSDYMSVSENGTQKALTDVASGTLALTSGIWTRKSSSALSLGILPIFHG